MNMEEIAKKLKDKVGLSDDIVSKVAEFLAKNVSAGNVDKNKIVDSLTGKFNLDKEKAEKAYDAVAGALSGGLLDAAKRLFSK